MSRERAKGTRLETAFRTFARLATGDDRIERMPLHGSRDVGDISGLYRAGRPLVVEVKNCRRTELAAWADEAERERGNADALAWAVAFKRRGRGIETPEGMGDQFVLMDWASYMALVTGDRWEEKE